MRRYYRIFVSSPYKELVRERRSVIDALLQHEHIPVAMEYFAAGAQRSTDELKKRIESCDLMVAVIGFKAGSIVPGDGQGRSFSEFEFDYAVECGKPVLSFIRERKKPSGATRIQPPADRLREKAKSYLPSYWSDGTELTSAVLAGISAEIKKGGLEGLVKASGYLRPFVDTHIDLKNPLFEDWAEFLAEKTARKLITLTQEKARTSPRLTYYDEVIKWVESIVNNKRRPDRGITVDAICTQKEWSDDKVEDYFNTYYRLARKYKNVTVRRAFIEISSWPRKGKEFDKGKPTVWHHVKSHADAKNVEPRILRSAELKKLPDNLHRFGKLSGFVLLKGPSTYHSAMLHIDQKDQIWVSMIKYTKGKRELFDLIEGLFDQVWQASKPPARARAVRNKRTKR